MARFTIVYIHNDGSDQSGVSWRDAENAEQACRDERAEQDHAAPVTIIAAFEGHLPDVSGDEQGVTVSDPVAKVGK